jgi:hypothetical protein
MANTIVDLNAPVIVASLKDYSFDVLKHIEVDRSVVTDRFQVKMIMEIQARDELEVYSRLIEAFKLCVPNQA